MPRAFPDCPRVLVAGLGRCGTSLVMQMLAASGLSCLGTFPDYEDPALLGPTAAVNAATLAPFDAAKWLNPMLTPEPPGRALIVWLDRRPVEQARSQIKFLSLMTGTPAQTDKLDHWVAAVERDRERSLERLRWRDRIEVQFEHLLAAPDEAAAAIAGFLSPHGFVLHPEVMGAWVVAWGGAWAPDMTMEHRLMERGLPNGNDA
jgi:hypothetical protein